MRSIRSAVIVLAAAACVVPPIHAQVLSEAESAALPAAGFEDHVVPIGRVEDGVLRVTLEAGPAQWRPVGEDGTAIEVTRRGLRAHTATARRAAERNTRLAERMRHVGIERVVFSTDWPFFPPAETRAPGSHGTGRGCAMCCPWSRLSLLRRS